MEELAERQLYNAAVDFIDANVVRGLADKVAFIDPDRSITYGALQQRTFRFAHMLHQLGVERENRVAILMNDTVDYPVAFWGTVRSGAVAIPLNTYLTVSQYAYILADCRANTLIIATPLAEMLRDVLGGLPHLKHIVLLDAAATDLAKFPRGKTHLFEDALAAASHEAFTADTISDEVAFWLYTSGSTGDPKGVRHVHTSLMATAKLFGQAVLRHPGKRHRSLGLEIIFCLWPRQCDDFSTFGRGHRRVVAG